MNYEEKYKEALETVQEILDSGSDSIKMSRLKLRLQSVFPELKESEDERMLRNFKSYLQEEIEAYTYDCRGEEDRQKLKMLKHIQALLEKQGEKPNPYSGVSFECNGHTWGMCARDYGVDISLDGQLFKHIEAQGEQKRLGYPYVTGWRENRPDNKPQIKHSVLMLTTHGVVEGEWLGDGWHQYRWTCKVKDTDVLYWLHLSDLESLEKEGNNNSISSEEVSKSIIRGIAGSLINYLDDNRYEGAMNMSSMECEDLEKAILDSDWGKVYRYMRKKLEKHDVQKETNLIEILKHYPRETELYSPIYGKLYLAEVDEKNEIITCYKNRLAEGCTRAILEQEDTVSFYSDGTTGLPDFNVSKDCMLFLYDIAKQGVQNPANKIKPKFNVRDWVVYETEEWKEVLQIETLESGCYTFTNGSSSSFAEEQNMRLWNIQDAKDGDVLVCIAKHGQVIGIVKKYIGKYRGCDKCFEAYCLVDWYGVFRTGEYIGSREIHPADKEQRELLFSKMKEAGYEWDADKKELKIIDWSKHITCGHDNPSITEQTDKENS